MYRDSDDDEKMAKWKHFAMTVETEYWVITNENDLYFMHQNLRSSDLLPRNNELAKPLGKLFITDLEQDNLFWWGCFNMVDFD